MHAKNLSCVLLKST